ncbi:MAG: hypothetical protein IIA83_00100 [Thaumarchaeota archaeon]|nr:hypothetical protein [Nitrososphaerota archaeon]
MSTFQAGYAFVALISLVLGIVFFFIDGMLLWSIAFGSLFIILVLFRMIWNISGWAENITRKLGDEQ